MGDGKIRTILLITIFLINAEIPKADAGESGAAFREYRFIYGGSNDLYTVANLGVNSYAVLTDLYYLKLAGHIPESFEGVSAAIWQTCCSFMLTIWPHEFGHWARARQVGGEFVFVKFGIPWPDARMDLPANIDLFPETLTSVGGFEINSLMHRMIAESYYARNYGYANLGIHAFIQQIYYPAYAFVVAPLVSRKWIDPRDADTWIRTMGDPVESALLTYRNYSGIPIPEKGEPVDPGLVSYYRECIWMNLVWTLLNPGLYEGIRAFGVPMEKRGGYMEPFFSGKNGNSWMYGTLFNASPLGYELYFDQHIRIAGRYVRCSLRYGRPFKNYGIEMRVPELGQWEKFRLGADLAYWYQETFGHGLQLGAECGLSDGRSGIQVSGGWKSRGYVLGMPVEQGFYVRGGINLFFENGE
ncbi:MAG: hypothetical protein WC372_07095 [Candidatus Neomarinimicrobiota bacterium]|nr:hypothetical protein [Candidatus Neomarinimicrobiota bacterium]MDD3967041.1 hypothetical protein [Candidatus Neomarinimicrobiota bacterium]MDX9779925.1 hypothetical protein [bacterium]